MSANMNNIPRPPPAAPTVTAATRMTPATDSGFAAQPQIPDHQLLRCIGSGSYGDVWLAKSVMGTFRAVKVAYRQRFEDERPFDREFTGVRNFEPVSRSHDGLVDVLHVGRNDEAGYFYYVMELADAVDGSRTVDAAKYQPRTLRAELNKRGRLSVEECIALGVMLTAALAHLHRHGLIHRDVKLSNIVYVDGVPKLADIGLVAATTDSRSYVGTEGYIPPEGPGTAQADLYSLGKVLYESMTGKDRAQFPELPSASNQTGDSARRNRLNEIILHACEENVRNRYQSAAEMLAELEQLKRGEPVRRKRRLSRAAAVAAVVGLVAALSGVAVFYRLQRPVAKPQPVRAEAPQAPVKAPQLFKMLRARWGPACLSDGEFVYAMGGAVHAQFYGDMERFDRSSGQSVRITDKLIPRRWHSAVIRGGRIYIFGGTKSDGGPAKEVEIFDLDTGEITLGAPMPTPRVRAMAALIGDRVYLVGGATGRELVEGRLEDKNLLRTGVVEVYDIPNNQWSAGPAMPTARECAVVVASDKIFAIGGWNGQQALTTFELFDPISGRWQKLPDMPFPTSAHSAVSCGRFIFCFGDYTQLDRVSGYDRATGKWKELRTNYQPSRHNAAFLIDNTVYIVGGNKNALEFIDFIQALDVKELVRLMG
jgi:hypothetical protein